MRIATLALAVLAMASPAFAGPELPMYQMPQANRMPMLPDPASKPGHFAGTPCTPVQGPQSEPSQTVTADATTATQKYHLVDGKCVVDGGR